MSRTYKNYDLLMPLAPHCCRFAPQNLLLV